MSLLIEFELRGAAQESLNALCTTHYTTRMCFPRYFLGLGLSAALLRLAWSSGLKGAA
jgi:hypothetical protein